MTREEVKQKILGILTSDEQMSLQIRVEEITDDTSLLTDARLDSIQILELTVALEQSFGFTMSSEELSLTLFDRFGALVDHVWAQT